ncbi:MAG: toll/interleukin-1 receptor domain-containing protein [Rhizobiales bacterium]|nr:toll/interleukin-1 receptor domain-containing protein [Hyphomicrobiales bacterium]
MPKIFDWRDHENDSDYRQRYDGVLGELRPWYDLVDALREGPGERTRLNLFEKFLEDIPGAVQSKRKTCVFISHRKHDTDKAERIVCLADHHNLDYWVDVHSPALRYVNNKLKRGDPLRSILIAAVIEIALLCCTHVIAVHTTNSLKSRWVPYELARAKARQIRSTQAAGWFETGQNWKTCGYYVQLAVMANSEADVMGWLASVPGATKVSPPVASPCSTHNNVVELK